MRNIVDLLRHPGFNNSLDAGDFLHGSYYTEELVDTYLQLNKKEYRSGYYFPGRPPVYQTLGGQNQEAKLHARSYSSQFPIHRQRNAYTVILIHLNKALVRPHVEYAVWVKCVVTIQAL